MILSIFEKVSKLWQKMKNFKFRIFFMIDQMLRDSGHQTHDQSLVHKKSWYLGLGSTNFISRPKNPKNPAPKYHIFWI
jgi:hypothetical protein